MCHISNDIPSKYWLMILSLITSRYINTVFQLAGRLHKKVEIVHYYCAFCSLKSAEPNLNPSANSVKLLLRKPLIPYYDLKNAD